MTPERSRPLLIVVADDGGIDVARNRGIVAGCAAGAVGAVSVLGTGAALGDLAARLRDLPARHAPDVGLHLNLTEGRALSGPIGGVTDAAGAFCGDKRELWRRALEGGVDAAGVRREVVAQAERLAEAGLPPVRIDGHQHVHVLPGVREGVAAAMAQLAAIRWTRLGRPVSADVPGQVLFPRLPPDRVAAAWLPAQDAGRLAQAALGTLHDECGLLRDAGLRSADLFAGADLLAAPGFSTCLTVIATAAAAARAAGLASIELMTHPGDCDDDSVAFSAEPARRTEREALADPALLERVAALGVEIARFRDLERRATGPGA